jgi:hypothetical protein
MDIELQFDAGKIDIIFSGDANNYSYFNCSVTLEQALNLADDLRDMVNNQRGERSPRVYDAEYEHLERILQASNRLGAISTATDELRDRVQDWLNGRYSFAQCAICKHGKLQEETDDRK